MGLVLISDVLLMRRFRSLKIALISKTNPDNLESIQNNRPTRWTGDVVLSTHDKNENGKEKHTERKQVRGPEIDVCFKLSGCQTGESANVDGPVKPSVHALDGNGGINDDAFAVFEDFDVAFGICVLFNDQGGDVRFDSPSAHPDDNHGDDEAAGVGGSAG